MQNLFDDEEKEVFENLGQAVVEAAILEIEWLTLAYQVADGDVTSTVREELSAAQIRRDRILKEALLYHTEESESALKPSIADELVNIFRVNRDLHTLV